MSGWCPKGHYCLHNGPLFVFVLSQTNTVYVCSIFPSALRFPSGYCCTFKQNIFSRISVNIVRTSVTVTVRCEKDWSNMLKRFPTASSESSWTKVTISMVRKKQAIFHTDTYKNVKCREAFRSWRNFVMAVGKRKPHFYFGFVLSDFTREVSF